MTWKGTAFLGTEEECQVFAKGLEYGVDVGDALRSEALDGVISS
jgi:hypothetical protein